MWNGGGTFGKKYVGLDYSRFTGTTGQFAFTDSRKPMGLFGKSGRCGKIRGTKWH